MTLKEIMASSVGVAAQGSVLNLAGLLGLSGAFTLRQLLERGTIELVKREQRIKHVFVLMLENRSFDHIFGFSGIEGIDIRTGKRKAVEGLTQLDPNSLPKQKRATDSNLDDIANPKPEAVLKINDPDKEPPHEFHDVVTQLTGRPFDKKNALNHGEYGAVDNSGFLRAYVRAYAETETGAPNPEKVMDCFSPDKVPILIQLANEFAICDNWFCSMPGPTWPNRFFIYAASAGGLDHSPSTDEVISSSLIDGYKFENGTFFDLLSKHEIDWVIFEGDEFPVAFALDGMNQHALANHFIEFDEFEDEINRNDFHAKYIFIEPTYNALSVSHEMYVCGTSMHPRDDVSRGERLIKKVYETIRNSRIWEQSALVILFDEHGGFFDHVIPPKVTPPGDKTLDHDNTRHGFRFDQLGPRVPAIVVSPWIPRNVVDSTMYDHTSVLATVERLLGLPALTNRDASALDFLHLFSLSAPRETPTGLGNAADSGFLCGNDDDRDQGIGMLSQAINVLAGEPKSDEGSLPGFLQIASRRHLLLTPPDQRADEIVRLRSLRSTDEMRSFLEDLRSQVQLTRGSSRRKN